MSAFFYLAMLLPLVCYTPEANDEREAAEKNPLSSLAHLRRSKHHRLALELNWSDRVDCSFTRKTGKVKHHRGHCQYEATGEIVFPEGIDVSSAPRPSSLIDLTDWSYNAKENVQWLDEDRIGSDSIENYDNDARYGPKSAFKYQENGEAPFIARGPLPRKVWYRFSQPTLIAMFGFALRRDRGQGDNDPTDFDFIGSPDCSTWTVIKSVHYEWQWVERWWNINEKESRRLMLDNSFYCYGFQIRRVKNAVGDGPAMHAIKMWKVEKKSALRSYYCRAQEGAVFTETDFSQSMHDTCIQKFQDNQHGERCEFDRDEEIRYNGKCSNEHDNTCSTSSTPRDALTEQSSMCEGWLERVQGR